MNLFGNDKAMCGLFGGKIGPTPEDDDGDEEEEDGSGDNTHC
jgi:hypothetical protein